LVVVEIPLVPGDDIAIVSHPSRAELAGGGVVEHSVEFGHMFCGSRRSDVPIALRQKPSTG
jgi:hypothetical protein